MKPKSVHVRSSALGMALMALVSTSLVAIPVAPLAAQGGALDGTISRPVVQPLPSRGSFELNAALNRLAANPRDVDALIAAGMAAMTLGDSEAAMGFLGRADQLSPANPRVKSTLASAMVRNENPFDAIPLFDAAERAGANDAMLAGDRGLAYDLVGDNPSAQRYYRQALAAAPPGEMADEFARRLALSMAIYGDRKGFEAALLPQLRAPGTASWRARAFGLAILGDEAEAVKIAYGTMPRDQAEAMAPYLRYMIRLTPAQQAAAANFGHFPRAAQIGRDDPRVAVFAAALPRRARTADAALVPDGRALGTKTANAKPAKSKSSRKRKGDTRVAIAAPPPTPAARFAPPPLPTPTPSPVARAPVRIAAATLPPAVLQPAPRTTPVPQPSVTLAPAPRPTPTPAATSPSAIGPAPLPAAAVTPPPAVTRPASSPLVLAQATSAPTPALAPSPVLVTPAPSNFDLALLAQKAAPTPTPTTPTPAPTPALTPAQSPVVSSTVAATTAPVATSTPAPAPARLRLADAFSDFRPPEDEGRSAVAAVDIGKLAPAKPRPSAAKGGAKAIDERGPIPGAPSGTRRSATIETPASARAAKSAGSDKAKPSAPSHPSRIWIQLAAGRDKAALGFDWRKLTRASTDLFKAKKGWTTPWGQTNRLLAGPFESQAAAATFLKELKKKDADAFVWTSPAGQAVDALAAK